MSRPIDSIRGSAALRRQPGAAGERSQSVAPANLPVPVEPARSIPRGASPANGDAAIQAQVIGERRGLRAGPTIHDEARSSYTRVEWSGAWDRRRPQGVAAKTSI